MKAYGCLYCMTINGCKESIPWSEINKALPNDVIELYEHSQAQKTAIEAKIEGLFRWK